MPATERLVHVQDHHDPMASLADICSYIGYSRAVFLSQVGGWVMGGLSRNRQLHIEAVYSCKRLRTVTLCCETVPRNGECRKVRVAPSASAVLAPLSQHCYPTAVLYIRMRRSQSQMGSFGSAWFGTVRHSRRINPPSQKRLRMLSQRKCLQVPPVRLMPH